MKTNNTLMSVTVAQRVHVTCCCRESMHLRMNMLSAIKLVSNWISASKLLLHTVLFTKQLVAL